MTRGLSVYEKRYVQHWKRIFESERASTHTENRERVREKKHFLREAQLG